MVDIEIPLWKKKKNIKPETFWYDLGIVPCYTGEISWRKQYVG